MKIGRYLGVVSGRIDRDLLSALHAQLEATKEGAEIASDMVAGRVGRGASHRAMRAVEHRGDREREKVVESLSSALVTPIDREDLFRLSRSIDDVLDTIRDFVRESHLYRLPEQSRLEPMLSEVVIGVEALDGALEGLAGGKGDPALGALEARKAGGAIRRLYQYEIARVLTGEVTTDVLKERELIRRLEQAGQCITEAANAIADGAMKRWH